MLQPQLLTETRQWLAVNKPAGLNVEQLWDYPSLERWVYDYLKQSTGRNDPYLGIVHRLDRMTSGVVVMARNKSTLRALNQQFAARSVRKTYRAIVAAELPVGSKGQLIDYLYKDQALKRAFVYAQPKADRKRAELRYTCVAAAEGRSELQVEPATGRYHQIRIQLAAQGWPIVGDTLYGAPVALSEGRILLHAARLQFENPLNGESTLITAPLPSTEAWLSQA